MAAGPNCVLLAPHIHSKCAGSAPSSQLMPLTLQARHRLLIAPHILSLFAGSACTLQQVTALGAAGNPSVPQLAAPHVPPCTRPTIGCWWHP